MKKGFTLIELLAVIVILAIIAVITVPKVAEMIDTSREGASQDAFYGTIKSAELAWAKGLEKDKTLLGTECTFSSEGAASCSNSNVEISTSGKNAQAGKVTIDANGAAIVYAEDSLLFNGYYCCGNSSKTYCKRNSVPEVSETNGICTAGSGGGAAGGGGTPAATLLKSKVVTTGEGLYADPVETERYVYKGADPDNYIWLDLNGDTAKTDNEIYRIVAVDPDNTIKVVAQNSLGYMLLDVGYGTSISGVTNANSNEGTRYSSTSTDYCYKPSASSYWGCKIWGSNTTMLDSNGNNVTSMPWVAGSTTTYALPSTEAYLNTYLNTTFLNGINASLQSKIVIHTYNVGPLAKTSGQTLATDVEQERAYKWKGKIALINATDYVKASTNVKCTSVYEYGNTACYNNSDTHNYLFHSAFEWTISPESDAYSYVENRVWDISSTGILTANRNSDNTSLEAWPSFYLTSNITLSGSGTDIDPYTIVS